MVEIFSYLIAFCFIAYSLDFKIDNYYTIIFLFLIRIVWCIAYEYEYISDLIFYLSLFCFLDIIIFILVLCNNYLYLPIRISSAIAITLSLYQLLFLFNIGLYYKHIITISDLNMEIVLGLFNLKTKIKTFTLMSILMLPRLSFII